VSDHFDYAVRVSQRAKHVRLTITVHGGLTVVVPEGFDPGEIPGLLEEKRAWIERSLAKIESARANMPRPGRPDSLDFHATQESWAIEWDQVDGRRPVTRVFPGCRLLAHGDVEDRSLWHALLRGWLMKKASEVLRPWMERIAIEHGFTPPKISIRCQKSRWGSCSARGNVNLNAQLLFIPPELVNYVLLHELCHTIHHNHSSAFWSLVREHELNTDRLRKELRSAWRYVPPWIATPET